MKAPSAFRALPPIGFNAPPDTAAPHVPLIAGLLLAIVMLASGAAPGLWREIGAAFAPPADRYAVSFKIETRWCEEHQQSSVNPNSCGGPDHAARIERTARVDRSNLRAPAVSFQEARR